MYLAQRTNTDRCLRRSIFTSIATLSSCSALRASSFPWCTRFGFNPVLGYLGAGAILGPLGLGSFIGSFPFLYWFTVVDAKNVSGFATLASCFCCS
jgi:Kef-type K+ transport system membrane component KefB